MGNAIQERDMMAIYATGYTTCTVTVDATNLTITANALATNFALGTYTTITLLVNAINAAAPGQLFARVLGGSASSDSGGLLPVSATNILLQANETYLRGLDYAAVDSAINAASDAFERYCGKTFNSTAFEGFYDGTGRPFLILKHSPIISVARVCIGKRDGLTIYNTLTDNSDATVSVTATNVVLRIFGGTNDGTDSISISTNTLTQLVTAINALGKGWVASVTDSTAAAWKGSELFRRSPTSARNSTRVSLYVPEVADVSYGFEEATGIIYRGTDARAPSWGIYGGDSWYGGMTYTGAPMSHIAPLTEPGGRVWPVGQFNIYVDYTAGYATLPADLAMLCNEAAANILRSGARDLTLRSESMQGYAWTASSAAMSDEVESWFSGSIKRRLKQFINVIPAPRYMAA